MLVFITINFTTIIKWREQVAQKEETVWKGTVYTVVTHEQNHRRDVSKVDPPLHWKLANLFMSGKLTLIFVPFKAEQWERSFYTCTLSPGVCGVLSEHRSFIFAPTQQLDLWGAQTHTLHFDSVHKLCSLCGRAAQVPSSVHSTTFSRTLLIVDGANPHFLTHICLKIFIISVGFK